MERGGGERREREDKGRGEREWWRRNEEERSGRVNERGREIKRVGERTWREEKEHRGRRERKK